MEKHSYSLSQIMNSTLPPIYIQKRLPYRPKKNDVKYVYGLLNQHIFDNKLVIPNIILQSHCKKYWGMCVADTTLNITGSYCTIKLSDKWFCPQWMVTVLAHEMCHQYQWDIDGPKREKQGKKSLLSHGPSFFKFKNKLHKHNISLKTSHGQKRWFKHQDLFKC